MGRRQIMWLLTPGLLLVAQSVAASMISYCDNNATLIPAADVDVTSATIQNPYYIYSQEDADRLTQNGCVYLACPLVVSPNSTTVVSLDILSSVSQYVQVVSSASLDLFSAPALSQVSGPLTFSNLTNLSSINLPKLYFVDGNVTFSSLPRLSGALDFLPNQTIIDSGGLNVLETNLTRLTVPIAGSGLSPNRGIQFVNNPMLEFVDLSMDASDGYVDGDFYGVNVTFSGGRDTTVYFPQILNVGSLLLEQCSNINFSTLSSAHSIILQNNSLSTLNLPSLSTVGNMTVQNNSMLTQIELPLLQGFDYLEAGNLIIQNNPVLQQLNFPKYTKASIFILRNNPALSNLTSVLKQLSNLSIVGNLNISSISFPALSLVTNMTITGQVVNASFPVLNLWEYVNVTSTSQGFDCSGLDEDSQAQGNHYTSYVCQALPPGATQDTAIHLHSLHDSSFSVGAQAGVAVGVILGLGLGLATLGWWFCYRRRKTQQRAMQNPAGGGAPNGEDGLPKYDDHFIETPPTYDNSTAARPPVYIEPSAGAGGAQVDGDILLEELSRGNNNLDAGGEISSSHDGALISDHTGSNVVSREESELHNHDIAPTA